MNLIQQFNDAILDYLESGKRQELQHREHNHSLSEGKIFASSIGLCPKNAAYERNGVEPTNTLSTEDSLRNELRMISGGRIAEIIQEALIYAYGKERVIVEESMESGGVRGRVDVIVRLQNEDTDEWEYTLIEIKWTRNRYFSPKVSQVHQMMWYINNLDHENAFGVELRKNKSHYLLGIDEGFHWYELFDMGSGMYQLRQDGMPYDASWNNAKRLSMTELNRLIDLHKSYLSGKINEVPFKDFLNDDGGWQCFEWEIKPTKEREGLITPRCPYFSTCHANNFRAVKNGKQYQLLEVL